jgi:hypothetical protein
MESPMRGYLLWELLDNRCIRPSVFDWDVGERHGVGDPTGVGGGRRLQFGNGVAQRGFYTDGYRWIWSRVRRTRVERWRRQLWWRRLGRCVRIAGRVLDERLGRNPSRRLFSDVSGICVWRSSDAHSLRISRRRRGLFLWRTAGRWGSEYTPLFPPTNLPRRPSQTPWRSPRWRAPFSSRLSGAAGADIGRLRGPPGSASRTRWESARAAVL